MYQTFHCVVTCNRGLNNGLNTESSKVSIKGILGAFLWHDQDQWSEITPIILDQMNQRILVQGGFIGLFDLPWSEWSQITDPDPDHRKGTHPLTISWMILLFCEDPVVGSLTSLECALDGFHKLSHMAEEVFGEDVFSSGRKKGKQNKNVSGKKMTLFYRNVSLQLSNVTSQDMSLNSLSGMLLFCACCYPLFIQQQLLPFPKTLYYCFNCVNNKMFQSDWFITAHIFIT